MVCFVVLKVFLYFLSKLGVLINWVLWLFVKGCKILFFNCLVVFFKLFLICLRVGFNWVFSGCKKEIFFWVFI